MARRPPRDSDRHDLSGGRGAVIRAAAAESSRQAHEGFPIPGYYDVRAELLEAGEAVEFADWEMRRLGVPISIPFLTPRRFLLTEDDRVVEMTRGPST